MQSVFMRAHCVGESRCSALRCCVFNFATSLVWWLGIHSRVRVAVICCYAPCGALLSSETVTEADATKHFVLLCFWHLQAGALHSSYTTLLWQAINLIPNDLHRRPRAGGITV
jgi:hypothetical protein